MSHSDPLASDACRQQLLTIARTAGDAIMEVYRHCDGIKVDSKADDSPLTQADLAAHHIIVEGLAQLSPQLPVLSEEGQLPDFSERSQWQRYWLIDPLDGTKEFINRNDEFTVNIALIEAGRPRLGLVYAPALALAFWGNTLGDSDIACQYRGDICSANAQPIAAAPQALGQTLAVVGSRRHGAEALEALVAKLQQQFGEIEFKAMGSSLKLCLVASGEAQLYPRLAPTCEWDTAAAQAVVEAAGGQVLGPDFKPLSYNHKADILNPHFYVIGDNSLGWPKLLSP
ncbi:MAG: 3'(2'),5'-bisphosphate nucleotidase CysQ [Cellvibrionaceae bacterium]|nr:3'(2'),5'-bisphosphate nucleotidase CysQ [Cellvibrionaceae bacterium]